MSKCEMQKTLRMCDAVGDTDWRSQNNTGRFVVFNHVKQLMMKSISCTMWIACKNYSIGQTMKWRRMDKVDDEKDNCIS